MKKILLFILIIYSTNLFSQEDPNIYDFFGGKAFGNKTVFFRLVFQINNGNINGYMYTDEQGKSETKSIIKGRFNSKTKRISFTETRKLLSRATNNFDPLCYLQGNITLELNPNISKLKGLFIEQTAAKQKCKNGTINLISPDAFIKLKKQVKKEKNTISKPVEIVTQTKKTITPTFDSDKKTTIKDDDEIIIYWESDTIKLSIWDDMKEDGDKISIKFNDEIVLDNYELKNKKEEIELELEEKENILIFTANNTGLLANNTARIDLLDNKIKHEIITELQLNKSVKIIIKNNN